MRITTWATTTLVFMLGTACGDDAATVQIDAPPGTPGSPDARQWDASTAACVPSAGTTVVALPVTRIAEAALLVTAPAGDRRLFIVGRDGRIYIYDQGELRAQPFLDLSEDATLVSGGEQGLLGLAFHPQYLSNGRFYIYYTTRNANVVEEVKARATDGNAADPATRRIVLSVPDFASNHNGGMIEFGDDGFLYIGTGDGGGGGDPQETGQNADNLLGKMLRIDVDSAVPYAIPPGNPFAGGGGRPEILALGLRNPWRWSFDHTADNLYIGDVGQNEVEEVSAIPVASAPGANFGWDQYEGSQCFEGPCNPAGKTMPVREHSQSDGWCSVIGGAVYRGACYSGLVGRYFYTDYCAGGLRSFVLNNGVATMAVTHPGTFPGRPTSLHPDGLGELYITSDTGNVFRLQAQ